MKKTQTLILAFIMVITLFVGCSLPFGTAEDESALPQAETSQTDSDSVGSQAEAEPLDDRLIELSGNAEDEFIAEKCCYAEAEEIVIFFDEGVRVKGDMLQIAAQVMSDLENYTGLSFDKNYEPKKYSSIIYDFEKNMAQFRNINTDHEKISIYVVDLGTDIPYAADNSIVVDSSDFYYEETSWQSLYHELSHVIHMRNGVTVGRVLSEGYAIYTTYETMKSCKKPPWDMVQYYGADTFDKSILNEEDAGFRYLFADKEPNYQYGIRFVTFLYETYGDDVFKNILNDATAENFDDTSNEPGARFTEGRNDQLKEIIRKNTSDDVFAEFSEWCKQNWETEEAEFWSYMSSIGLG